MTVRGCAFDAPLPFEQRGEAFFAYGSSADTGHKRTLLFQLMVFFFSRVRCAVWRLAGTDKPRHAGNETTSLPEQSSAGQSTDKTLARRVPAEVDRWGEVDL